LIVLLNLVEDLLELVVSPLFGGGLTLTKLFFGTLIVVGDVLAALHNAIVVKADAVEMPLTHVLSSLLSGSHSLSKLSLNLETL